MIAAAMLTFSLQRSSVAQTAFEDVIQMPLAALLQSSADMVPKDPVPGTVVVETIGTITGKGPLGYTMDLRVDTKAGTITGKGPSGYTMDLRVDTKAGTITGKGPGGYTMDLRVDTKAGTITGKGPGGYTMDLRVDVKAGTITGKGPGGYTMNLKCSGMLSKTLAAEPNPYTLSSGMPLRFWTGGAEASVLDLALSLLWF